MSHPNLVHARSFAFTAIALGAVLVFAAGASAADDTNTIDLGRFEIEAPTLWERKEPRSRIIAYEFAVPAAEGDEIDGRVTIMAAGGSVDENIKRWLGQFIQPDGGNTEDRAKIEEREIAGQKVHLVDIRGTYLDRPRPVAPAVERENYRMLGAVIVTDDAQLFVKFYGPQQTVDDHAKAFRQMIEGLEAK